MKQYNITAVYSPDKSQVLFCKRTKDPYKGLLNLVGGKVEPGEDSYVAAYRELEEETGITNKDITLRHLMTFQYFASGNEIQVFVGRLNHPVTLREEVNKLCWVDADDDFFDMAKYAGEGNVGHLLEEVKLHPEFLN